MKTFSVISSTILGMIFLISAFAKAWDSDAFADMLLQYGPQWFSIGAPVIIMIEVVLSMMLLLRIFPKWSAIFADCFLLCVSMIYAYGLLAKGIEGCGCFGIFSKLFESKPWVTFARNAIFIMISIPVVLESSRIKNVNWIKSIIIVFVVGLSCFVCGLSMKRSYSLPKLSSVKIENNINIFEKINKIYSFSTDSTYVVYLFSFTCPHCLNSFANLQQFQQFNVVDKVIGISIHNQEAKERFYRIYNPEIEIVTISEDEMQQITNQLPTVLLIKGNCIIKKEIGRVTSPGLFIK